jgi:hypothetical protein
MHPAKVRAERLEEILAIGVEIQVPDVKITVRTVSVEIPAYFGRNLMQSFLNAFTCCLTFFLWS